MLREVGGVRHCRVPSGRERLVILWWSSAIAPGLHALRVFSQPLAPYTWLAAARAASTEAEIYRSVRDGRRGREAVPVSYLDLFIG